MHRIENLEQLVAELHAALVALRQGAGYTRRMQRWRVTARPPKGRDGPSWQLVIRSPEGKLSQRSARTSDEGEARAAARLEADKLNGEARTVEAAIAARLSHLERTRAPANTASNYRYAMRRLAPLFGDRQPTREVVLEVRDTLEREIAAKTVNCYLDVAACAWRWARDRGHVTAPWPAVPRLKVSDSTKRAPSDDEAARLLQGLTSYGRWKARGSLFPVAALLYDVGSRVSETLAIRGQDVDRAALTIRLGETKTRKARTIRVSPEVMALLPVREDPRELVFQGPRGKPIPRRSVGRALREVRRRVGVSELVDLHSLRRGWITDYLRAGGSIEDGMRATGHDTARIYLSYARSALPADERELGKLRAYRGRALPVELPTDTAPDGAALALSREPATLGPVSSTGSRRGAGERSDGASRTAAAASSAKPMGQVGPALGPISPALIPGAWLLAELLAASQAARARLSLIALAAGEVPVSP